MLSLVLFFEALFFLVRSEKVSLSKILVARRLNCCLMQMFQSPTLSAQILVTIISLKQVAICRLLSSSAKIYEAKVPWRPFGAAFVAGRFPFRCVTLQIDRFSEDFALRHLITFQGRESNSPRTSYSPCDLEQGSDLGIKAL
ncbi:hypothetical protein CEXT_281991 [Caerostris extrusa]|uniref:Secreted protein n=1 Tax=Caerostris extrusa TaxID=172846 RepID=A0AAV4TP12_CAEEX|nr:hypothetical protein CEXT_281991 [Caerostris extrusa]